MYKQMYPREFKFVDHAFWPLLATLFFVPPLIVSLWPRSLDIIGMGFDNTLSGQPGAAGHRSPGRSSAPRSTCTCGSLGRRRWQNLATEMERVQLVGEEESAASNGR